MAGEFDLINWIRGQTAPQAQVVIPPGDDLATVRWKADDLLLVGVDQVLDQVHFDSAIHPPRQIGAKVMNRNLSDCAAMACLPAFAVTSVALPIGTNLQYAQQLYLGMKDAGAKFDCAIIGGDTGSWNGKLALSLTIIGKSAGIPPITRSGAQVGDHVYVTGKLGGSILGRHVDFTPRIHEARHLAQHHRITAMMDLSDGLSRDLAHICRESKVGAILEGGLIPIHDDAMELSHRDGVAPLDHALHDGEDYELLFTSPDHIDPLLATRIGVITQAPTLHINIAGRSQELRQWMGARTVNPSGRLHLPLFGITIFLGAFLLFAVQPMIARYILPWFGGSPGVWTACMVFFQVALLAGYLYADVMIRKFSPRSAMITHTILLLMGVVFLPIIPAEGWKPVGADDPTWRIVMLLIRTVGWPYIMLATTGPLLQAWLARSRQNISPYRLYALSNIGSLLALLAYPFVIEPLLSRRAQAVTWSFGFGIYILLAIVCAIISSRRKTVEPHLEQKPARTPIHHRTLWIAFPVCSTMLLLGTTNKICQEVAVIPFLWILPLALYLLSFIIAFDRPRWYHRGVWTGLLPVFMILIAIAMLIGGRMGLWAQIGAYTLGFFVACMVCHGEVARIKPHTSHLTAYYLFIAAGGALGGLFVALVAPLVFTSYFEFPLSWMLCAILVLAVLYIDPSSKLNAGRPNWAWILIITAGGLIFYTMIDSHVAAPGRIIESSRSFHGALTVCSQFEDKPADHVYLLRHGGITHGLQFARPDLRATTSTYYTTTSGTGLTLRSFPADQPLHIGVVGLGVGTLAAYAQADDEMRFYEINPDVLRLAQKHFTFLKDSPAQIQHVIGDARLSLEREPAQRFDVLVLDAFSGDAIPVHLLTQQAFALYRKHLADDGVLAIHITNQHLDLSPVIRGGCKHLGWKTILVADDPTTRSNIAEKSDWMICARDQARLDAIVPPDKQKKTTGELNWTDDHASLFSILRSRE